MASETPSRVECKDCGAPIDEPSDTAPETRKRCPSCGSITRHTKVEVADTLEFHASLGYKAKSQSKWKPYLEGRSGDDLHRKTGKWMFLEQVIDRAKNWYKELITDPETGEVVRHCEEPLTDHRDRGSAKKRDRNSE